jgi:hypothetical protein
MTQPSEAPARQQPVTYFKYCRRCQRVKIGWTRDPLKRYYALELSHARRYHHGERVSLVALAYFDGKREKEFHARFDADSYDGRDWFEYSAAVHDFLAKEGFPRGAKSKYRPARPQVPNSRQTPPTRRRKIRPANG